MLPIAVDIARYFRFTAIPARLLTEERVLKNLAPTYEQLADAYSHVKDKVIIAKVDADAAANKPVAQKYGVTGFPSESALSTITREVPSLYSTA